MMSNIFYYFCKIKLYILIGYLIPLALLLWFVANFSVNVPFLDQWVLVDFFEKVESKTANLGDLFAQHFEHRLFIPRIIFTILAFSSNWNVKLEQGCSVILAILSFYAMYKLSAIQETNNKQLFHLANISISMLYFSLVQFGNWLWGFQLQWYLPNFCIILAVFILYVPKSLSAYLKVLIAGLFCFLASFSSSHGLLSWLAMIPALLYFESNSSRRKKIILIWILMFILCCFIYSIGYQKPASSTDLFFFIKKPLIALAFILMMVGSSSVGLVINPALAGFFIMINFLFLNSYYFKSLGSQFARNAAPWLSLGWFSMLVVLTIGLGRVGYGVGNALQTRYTTGTILIVISCLQMWRLLVDNEKILENKKKDISISISCFIFGLITAFFIAYSTQGIADGREVWLQKTSGKTCLEVVYYLEQSVEELPDSCLHSITGEPFKGLLRSSVDGLNRLGFRTFPTDIKFAIASKKLYGNIEIPAQTDKFITLPKDMSIKLSGWAGLPDAREQPRVVLFSYGDRKTFFANAVIKLPRPEIGRILKHSRYSKIGWDRFGWEVNISGQSLPVGENLIKAWVYDKNNKRFVQLNNILKLKVITD
ncbi:MAG TPA: hypothetical protein V6D28_13170 [Leptolyngbyaceae cyanobacterium]